jgi:DNA-binding SARP family transcriptional activator
VEGGTIWVLDPSLSAANLEALAESSWPFLPALVSVGETPAGTVLVNLEHAGILRLCGDPGAVRSALAEVVLELRCQPWSIDAVARLILDGVGLASPSSSRSEIGSGVALTRDSADAAIRAAARCAEGVGQMSTAATLRATSFQWLPTAVVCGAESDQVLVDQLCEAAVPERSGLVVVAAGDEEGAWQLRLEAGGTAVLRGVLDGATFTLPMERHAEHGLVGRLGEALDRPLGEPLPGSDDEDEGPGPLPNLTGTMELPELDRWIAEVEGEWEDGEVAGVDDIEGEAQVVAFRSHSAGDASLTIDLVEEPIPESPGRAIQEEGAGALPEPLLADESRVELTILGPVGLTGSADLAAVPASRQASALAVIAFLATRDRPVSADEIAAALWPTDSAKDNFGEPRRKTVMNVISRARSLLGEPIDGPSRLLLTDRGYVLSSEVQCDWTRFEELLETDFGGPEDEAILLRSALDLVKGPPLAGSLSSPFFEWVCAQHLDLAMEARVVDAAERLGVVALDLGDLTLAELAVRKGLELDPAREELYRVWMHVAGRLGRPDQVDEVYRRLCRALQRHLDAGMAPSEASEAVRSSYSGRPVRV